MCVRSTAANAIKRSFIAQTIWQLKYFCLYAREAHRIPLMIWQLTYWLANVLLYTKFSCGVSTHYSCLRQGLGLGLGLGYDWFCIHIADRGRTWPINWMKPIVLAVFRNSLGPKMEADVLTEAVSLTQQACIAFIINQPQNFRLIQWNIVFRFFQLQWLLAAGRSRSSALQIRAAQTHGAERRQAIQTLYRTITTDIESYTGC